MLKLSLSLMLIICLVACASVPSSKGSSQFKPTYVGERNEAGEPHGRGVMTWSEYTKYDGEFENGLYHGHGTFHDIKIIKMGYGTYVGAWVAGKPNGFGKFENVRHTYTGAWKDGLRHGTGSYTGPGKYKSYVGEWHENVFHGEGRLVLADGEIQEGIFTNGTCGHHEFANCKREKPNGDVIEGKFTTWGDPHVFAIYRYANGDVYEGAFQYGSRHGKGTFTPANGEVVSGLWEKGLTASQLQAIAREKEIAEAEASRKRELAVAAAAEARLQACDSFGFERGTDSHAECAMQLYINEQNQATASQVTEQQRKEQQAVLDQQKREQKALLARQRQQLARQEAVQEAILREQERARNWEQSMKLIELGTGIATGSLGGRSTPKMQSHTYTINGQIINCTTTGSSTNCY